MTNLIKRRGYYPGRVRELFDAVGDGGGSTVIGGRVTCICVMISLTLLRYIAVCATSRCAR